MKISSFKELWQIYLVKRLEISAERENIEQITSVI